MTRENYNIVCISTIDWDFVWQGHQEIMSTLARQGHRVIFIENTGVRNVGLKDFPRIKNRFANWRKGVRGIRKVMDNLYVYAPLVLPFPYSRTARFINKIMMFWTLGRWTQSMRFDNPIIWTWLPTSLTLELIKFLDGQLVVYYCCGDLQASSIGSKKIRKTEDLLLRTADIVFAHSKAIFDRCSRLTDQVHIFQYGFNREVFARAQPGHLPDLESVKRPILGYVGGVHKVVDLVLLEKIARAHPDKSLVMVGPLQVDVGGLAKLPNVYFLGQKRYEELPAYIKHFDVGLIPYVLNEYTQTVYPNKLNEYLIMGKPVISTRLPEVEFFNQCYQNVVSIADGHEDFVDRITEELQRDTESCRARRTALVEKNVWSEKIAAMQRLIQAKLEEKAKARELNWQDTLVRLYRNSRRKVLVAVGIGALSYGLIFYTSLLWFLAEPLRTAEVPEKVDAIAVLAGGIGESGEASDVYQEKVQYGVDLYWQGYGERLVFSSGAHYVFKEARVMKALAMALGVPERAILLDEVGGGNYGSLLNVKTMAREQGWTSLVVVTSRYNTRRSSLVVHENLPDLSVRVLAPAHSVFFGEREEVRWEHVRAIVHEYVAIVYYWAKRYI